MRKDGVKECEEEVETRGIRRRDEALEINSGGQEDSSEVFLICPSL